jgi:hypothetical protein
VEKHSVVYDVEATVGGKHLEFLIADTDGTVLGTEVPIEFGELPAPVRVAVERHFGTTMNLTIMKGEEFGETQYEVEGPSRGRKVEVTFDSAGKRKE